MKSPRRLFVMAALAVAGLVLLFVIDSSAWHWFLDEIWDRFKNNAEPWVAIGTILLALATGFLAWITRREIKASLDEVAVSRQALQTSIRPLLADPSVNTVLVKVDAAGVAPADMERFGYATWTIPLLNVGSGLALIQRFELVGLGIEWTGTAHQTALLPGVVGEFVFSVDLAYQEGLALRAKLFDADEYENLELRVSYSDIDGRQRTRTHAHIRGTKASFRLERILLYNDDETAPFAVLSAVPAE